MIGFIEDRSFLLGESTGLENLMAMHFALWSSIGVRSRPSSPPTQPERQERKGGAGKREAVDACL